ncbi:hypothetical protein A7D00_2259 [Trichophyton violaceum]|uniref:Fungal-specific transcription factor domain-containing protein n=1 Tax=Trichophyton violaceum TaxID=34388 RepID=A0A178FRN0_TRIVO|nr:hypothetical protein A7D00_2259 [Trichophyton violaceum]
MIWLAEIDSGTPAIVDKPFGEFAIEFRGALSSSATIVPMMSCTPKKPVRRRRARKVERGLLRDAEKPQQFEFIFEHSIIESETADTPLTTNFTLSGVPVEHITNGQSQDKESIEEIAPYAETPFETHGNESPVIQGEEASHNLDSIDRPAEPHQHQNNGKNPYTVLLLTESTADRQLQPYNREFCKIPLTSDLRINPFRYRKDLEPEPTFLVHAVMALAGHHVHSASTQDHRHAAFQLIREKLGSYNNTEDVYSMLDAVIILFSLDETQSAFGNWNTHLLGVYGLLEACDVMQSARLCAEKRKSSSMQCATFDTMILEIEQLLESWDHTSPATAIQDEECMQQDQDRMHCSEAWRNGLLLYTYRVFQWKLGSSVPLPILYRARAITDHVFACRDISMVSRQALLPLFFAGCELRDQSLRSKIVEFCCIWDRRIRYHMFSNTIPLLEEVWVEQAVKGFENVWWGQ